MEGYNPFGKQNAINQKQAPSTDSTSSSQSSSLPLGEAHPSEAAEQVQFPQFGNAGESRASQTSASNIGDLQKKIEAAKSNGWGSQAGEFIGKNKKRIALLAIAALLFGAGFYAYDKNSQDTPALNFAAISENIDTDSRKINTENAQKNENFLAQALDLQLNELQLNEDGELTLGDENSDTPLFIQDSSSVITKSAGAGEGITHLARYAIKDYLSEQGKTLTPEQKIYAEDYVQNRMGSELLEVGQKLSFAKDLMQEAIEDALGLEEWQLENLEQYTMNVSLL